MKPSLAKRIALLLVLFLPAPCFARGRDGHRIIGEIATSYLTPEAKAGVEALLGGQMLVDVGAWADQIRSDRSYRWASPLLSVAVETRSFPAVKGAGSGSPRAQPVVLVLSCGRPLWIWFTQVSAWAS